MHEGRDVRVNEEQGVRGQRRREGWSHYRWHTCTPPQAHTYFLAHARSVMGTHSSSWGYTTVQLHAHTGTHTHTQ